MTRVYLRPLGLVPADSAPPEAASLAGGRFCFSRLELIVRSGGSVSRRVLAPGELLAWSRGQPPDITGRIDTLLANLGRPRPAFAGLTLDRPRLMAVLNVTPDSFSDGGDFLDPAAAVAHGLALHQGGADLIDVGGESTRPGAAPVSINEEIGRVVPVIRALAARGARVSIDSRHAAVMRAALTAGALVLNDVSGLAGDPDSLGLAASSAAPVILMHMQGEPGTMQQAPHYEDAALEVYDWLEQRIDRCRAAGIAPDRLVVDPGIGFGKSLEHNLEILRALTLYHGLGTALCLGVSRKRFIAALSNGEPPRDRVAGTLAASLAGLDQGCQLLRIHDLAAFTQARAVWEGLHPGRAPPALARPGPMC
ncbi:MAG: dihydropteroate synthase [Rhodospirillaceae bacterium]